MPRFLMMIRIDEKIQPSDGPSPELMERMEVLLAEMGKAGVLLDTAGLAPTDQVSQVHWSGGRTTVTDGPFTESKEVVGGYIFVQTKDKAEAVEWAKRFARTHEDAWEFTLEIREVMEP